MVSDATLKELCLATGIITEDEFSLFLLDTNPQTLLLLKHFAAEGIKAHQVLYRARSELGETEHPFEDAESFRDGTSASEDAPLVTPALIDAVMTLTEQEIQATSNSLAVPADVVRRIFEKVLELKYQAVHNPTGEYRGSFVR